MRKLIGAALALSLVIATPLTLSSCDTVNAGSNVIGLGNVVVPSNVSQGATDLNLIVTGIRGGFTLIGYVPPPAVDTALNQLQAEAAAVGSATSNETAASLVAQFETGLNALVANEALDKNLPALAQTALQAASTALPIVEALIPLPAAAKARMAAMAPPHFAAAQPFASPQAALAFLQKLAN
jgi:hypothetical protein